MVMRRLSQNVFDIAMKSFGVTLTVLLCSNPINSQNLWSTVMSMWKSDKTQSASPDFSMLISSTNYGMRTVLRERSNHSAYAFSKPVVHTTQRYENSSVTPTKHSFEEVMVHRMKDNIKRLGSTTKAIFVGDSIVYRWSKNATIWTLLEKKYAAMNLGSPGM